ncbi:MAG: glycosyltransferase family 4 protein [Candidatus Krumholzibacteriota bacterium]|nr:glycosyltransferase family 4 protein [Candidatus Krumholzibacteriota bacterium]
MRVIFFTKYPRLGPSSRYRVFQYIPWLEGKGIECKVRALHSDGYLRSIFAGRRKSCWYYMRRFLGRILDVLGAPSYDAVFIQKELLPYNPPFLEFFLKIFRVKIIYDLDDAIYLYYSESNNPLVRALLRNKIPLVLGWSYVVLAGNSHLAAYASRYNRNTKRFPTVINPARYSSIPAREKDQPASAAPVVGWIGSPETLIHLHLHEDVLREVYRKAKFRLLVIGAPHYNPSELEVEAVPWSEDGEVSELARCDIGIMPLALHKLAAGKCGLKLLQYMAAGKPVISSPEGGAEDIVVEDKNGYIARTGEEWVERLTGLLLDPDRRRRLGREGRRWVEECYSLPQWGPRMVDIIRSTVEDSPGGDIRW